MSSSSDEAFSEADVVGEEKSAVAERSSVTAQCQDLQHCWVKYES